MRPSEWIDRRCIENGGDTLAAIIEWLDRPKLSSDDKVRQEYMSVVRSTQAMLSSLTPEERRSEIPSHTSLVKYVDQVAQEYVAIAYGQEGLKVLR